MEEMETMQVTSNTAQEEDRDCSEGNTAMGFALLGIGAACGVGLTLWWQKTKEKRDEKRRARAVKLLEAEGYHVELQGEAKSETK